MYIGIKSYWRSEENINLRNYLLSTEILEQTEHSSILKIDLKNLRKFKILSLHDKVIKESLSKLQAILNDETKIIMYGEKMPIFESGSTGLSGYSGSSGTEGRAGISYISQINEIFDLDIVEI